MQGQVDTYQKFRRAVLKAYQDTEQECIQESYTSLMNKTKRFSQILSDLRRAGLGKNTLSKFIINVFEEIKREQDQQFIDLISNDFKTAWLKKLIIEALDSNGKMTKTTFQNIIEFEVSGNLKEDSSNFFQQLIQSLNFSQEEKNKIKTLKDEIPQTSQWILLSQDVYPEIPQQAVPPNDSRPLEYFYQAQCSQDAQIGYQILKQLRLSQIPGYSFHNFARFTKKLKQLFNQIGYRNIDLDNYLKDNLNANENQNYSAKVKSIYLKIHPINIYELSQLFKKNKNVEQEIKFKDIIILLGVSGAGKTTLAQLLLGYRQRQNKIQGKLHTLVPEPPLEAKHQKFFAAASSVSITRHLNSIEIPVPEEYEQNVGQPILVDAPGFFDTAGATMELANGLSISAALGQANTITLILVINGKEIGKKLGALKDQIKNFSNMFKKLDTNKVLICLNQFQQGTLSNLFVQLKILEQQMTAIERDDKRFVGLLKKIINLLQKKESVSFIEHISKCHQMFLLTPLKPNLSEYYRKIFKTERRIEEPNQYINSGLTERAKRSLKSEIDVLENFIMKCFSAGKIGDGLHFLEQLNKLQEMTGSNTQSFLNVSEALNKEILNIQGEFNSQVKKMQHFIGRMVNRFTVDEASVSQAKRLYQRVKNLSDRYSKISFIDFNLIDYKQILDLGERELINKLQQKLEKVKIITALKFSQIFNRRDSIRQKIEKLLTEKDQYLTCSIQKTIQSEEYQNLDRNVAELKNLKQVCSLEEIQFSVDIEYERLFMEKVQGRQKQIQYIINRYQPSIYASTIGRSFSLQVSKITQEDLLSIKQALRIFSIFQYIQDPFIKIALSTAHSVKKKAVRDMCLGFIQHIGNIIDKQSNKSRTISKNIQQITSYIHNATNCANQIDQIRKEILSALNSELKKINETITTETRIIKGSLSQIEAQDWQYVEETHSSINYLKFLCQIDRQGENSRQLVDEAEKKLLSKLNSFHLELQRINCSIDNVENIDLNRILKANRINPTIQNEQNIQGDKVITICGKIKTQVKQIIESIMSEIQGFVTTIAKDDNSSFSNNFLQLKTSKIIKFFGQIKTTMLKPPNFQQRLKKLEENIKKSFSLFLKRKYEAISEFFDNVRDFSHFKTGEKEVQKLERGQIEKIKKQLQFFTRIFALNRISELLLVNEFDFHESLTNLLTETEKVIRAQFTELLQSNRYQICFLIKNHLEPLRYFSQYQGCSFSSLFSEMKDGLNNLLDQLGYTLAPNTFINQQDIDLHTLQRFYKFYSALPTGVPQRGYLTRMFNGLNVQISRRESMIQKNSAKHQIQNLLKVLIEINKIISNDDIKKFSIRLSEKTFSQILQLYAGVILDLRKRIQREVEEGKSEYEIFDSIIEEVAQIQIFQAAFPDTNLTKIISKAKSDLNWKRTLKQYYQSQKKNKISLRNKKYLKEKEIVIDQNFEKQFITFTNAQQEGIRLRVIDQYEHMIQSLIVNVGNEDITTLKCQVAKLEKTARFLPLKIRHDVQSKVSDRIQNFMQERQRNITMVRRQFSIERVAQILSKQTRSYILKQLEKLIQSYFADKIKQMHTYSDSTGILSFIARCFLSLKRRNNINTVQMLKWSFEKAMKQVYDYLFLIWTKKCGILKDFFNKKNYVLSSIIENIKDLKEVIEFMINNKDEFSDYSFSAILGKMKFSTEPLVKSIKQKAANLTIVGLRKNISIYKTWQSQCEVFEAFIEQFKDTQQIYKEFQQQLSIISSAQQKINLQIQEFIGSLIKKQLYSQTMKNNSKEDRTKFLQQIQQGIQFCEKLSLFPKLVSPDMTKKPNQSFINQIHEGFLRTLKCIKRGSTELDYEFDRQINISMTIMQFKGGFSLFTVKSDLKDQILQSIKECYKRRFEQVQQILQKLMVLKSKLRNDQSFAEDFIDQTEVELKKLIVTISYIYKSIMQIDYDREKYNIQSKRKVEEVGKKIGNKMVNRLLHLLMGNRNSYSQAILQKNEIFKSYKLLMWSARVKGRKFNDILKETRIMPSQIMSQKNSNEVNQKWINYSNEIQKWTHAYQLVPRQQTIQNLVQQINIESSYLTNFYHHAGSASLGKPEVLLARIFALWIIMNSTIIREEQQYEQLTVQFPFQPHAAQVLSIFLCLSFTSEDYPKQVNSKIAQISTGQGKSIVIAGVCSYLALCGFQVYSVCYSKYLSERDKDYFMPLLKKLQIQQKVNFGTFQKLCETLLNKSGEGSEGFRGEVKAMLTSPKQTFLTRLTKAFEKMRNLIKNLKLGRRENKKILIIDQIDVFFDDQFFGSVYRPEITLQGQQIYNLFHFIWKKYSKSGNITERDITNSSQFKRTVDKFPKLQELLFEQVKDMIIGCRNNQHNYVIHDDKIKYKDRHGISQNKNFGLITMFASLKQAENGKIRQSSLIDILRIGLIVAQFSYALLPKFFRSIIGVTGTYQTLSHQKKEYMESSYGVKQYIIIPSVYGKSSRTDKQPKIVEPDDHFMEIKKQVLQINQNKRPIIVFFEDESKLDECYKSLDPSTQKKVKFLKETHNSEERDNIIRDACLINKITFMTKPYGRGTDFVVNNQEIYKLGGLHVIQTFLSIESSEQTQIKGRTARQGGNGTFIYILSKANLTSTLGMDQNMLSIQSFETQLKAARNALEKNQWELFQKRLEQAEKSHKVCINKYLEDSNQSQIMEYIKSLNRNTNNVSKPIKTVILIDGTGSMSRMFSQLLTVLKRVMESINNILQKSHGGSSLELQLAVYRNYNVSPAKIYESTPFETKPYNLIKFLQTIKVEGGLNPGQAIQIGFYNINKIQNVDQVIVIGDAPCNTPQETKSHRAKYRGQSFWVENNIPLINSQEQIRKMVSKDIKIHSLCVDSTPKQSAKKYFRQLSQKNEQSKGQYMELNLKNSDSSKILSEFIAKTVFSQASSNQKQEELFMQMFRQRHS